ncbi:MAG: SemiSWEET family transporter [Chloroflexota bacterium]|nr:SemiSWEET family transporter [Chloroflexota bacterium]
MSGELLGFAAGVLSTFSVVPQLIRVFKLKSAREISTLFTLMLLLGIILWLAYGIYFMLLPVILWNAISTVLVGTLLAAKLKYGRSSTPETEKKSHRHQD